MGYFELGLGVFRSNRGECVVNCCADEQRECDCRMLWVRCC